MVAAEGVLIPFPVNPTSVISSAVGLIYKRVSESRVTPDVVAVVVSSVSLIDTMKSQYTDPCESS